MGLTAGVKHFWLHRGTSFRETVSWKDENGQTIDLDDYTVRLVARTDPQAQPIALEFSTDLGNALPSAPDAVALLLTPEDTLALVVGMYRYDMVVTQISTGETTRLLTGDLVIRDTLIED